MLPRPRPLRHRMITAALVVLGAAAGVAFGAVVAWAVFSAASTTQSNTFAAAPVDHIALSPSTSTITAGGSQAYTVTAYDASNNPLATVTSAAALSISPNGSCTAATCTATVSGSHTVTAQFWALSATATLTVNPSTATKLAFIQSPSNSTGGIPFPTQPIVAIEDTYGNIVTTDTSSVTLSITPGTPTSGGPGTLTCTTNPLAAVSGVATFSGCSINVTGTNYQLHATDGTLTPADSSPFNITSGPLDHFAVSNPGTQTAGRAFTVTVTALDAGGNLATGWTSTTACVTFSGPAPSPNATAPLYPPPGACPTGQSDLTFNSSGQATASITLYDAQTTSLTVTSNSAPGGKTGNSGTFTVNPSTLASFTVPTPATQTAGVTFNETITALDTWGNAAAGWTSTTACVTFSGPAPSPNATAPLYPPPGACPAGQSALTFNASGQATANITLYDAQTTTLAASDTTLTYTGTSGAFIVNPAGPKALTMISGDNQAATVNTAFGNPLVATVVDTYANPTPGAAITFTAPASGPSATFAAGCTSQPQPYVCVATADSTGTATTPTLSANATVGTYTITATAAGTNTLSYTETNTSGATLHIASLVTGSTSGTTTWNASVVVVVKDGLGNPVAGVAVTGNWNPTTATTASGCTTDGTGTCTITTTSGFPATQLTETWTVTNLSLGGSTYSPGSNSESSITVSRGCPATTVCTTDVGVTWDNTAATSSTSVTLNTASGTAPLNSSVLILIARDGSVSGDGITSITGTGISGASPVDSVTSNLSSRRGAFTNLWIYRATGTGTANGTITVTFNNADNLATVVEAVVVSGNNNTTPIAQSTHTTCPTGCTTAATANLITPAPTNAEIVLLAEAKDAAATTSTTPGMTLMYSNHLPGPKGYNVSTWADTSAQATSNFTLGTAAPWGSIAVEVAKSQ